MPASTPPEPDVIKMGLTQLWVMLGSTVSVIVALVAYLYSLLVERVKKCETSLESGGQTFEDIKLETRSNKESQETTIKAVAKVEVDIERLKESLTEVKTRQADCKQCP